jgi:transcriptional regulator with XRE-family HTH domain
MGAKGYGEIIKKAREDKDLSYAEVHKVVKMDPSYIKALEDENLAIFEKPVYMRFFLKTYSKYLKVDVAEVMRLYDFSPEIQEAEKRKERPKDHMVLGDIIKETEPRELEAAKSSLMKDDFNMITKQGVVVAGIAAGVIVLVLIIIFALKGKGTSQSQNNNVYVPTVTAPVGLKISIKAKDDVWMKARTSENGEEDFTLKKGEERKWKDTNRIVFFVGNAGAVEFNLNGESLGVIGEPGEFINGLVFETGKNWYIDKAQGFKRENPKPVTEQPTAAPTTAAAAPAAVTATATH